MRPFLIDIADDDLQDLRRRLENTRWPDAGTRTDRTQGLALSLVQELCEEWAHGYDWPRTQRRLNRIPQFVTRIDGLDVHFLHVRSVDPDATPLLLTHGWPGSFLEYEDALEPLTSGEPAFHVVVPSLPGYGFSGKPVEPGWTVHRIANAWAALMAELGYPEFVASGSDWGTSISTCIGMQHPQRIFGIHLVPPLAAPDPGEVPTPAERDARDELAQRAAQGSAYSAVHQTRPQTIGYALADSPAALLAWIGEKLLAWTDGEVLTRRQIFDNLSLYWFTRSGASSARLYAESIAEVSAWFTDPDALPRIEVPTAATVFPREVPRPSRHWAEHRYTQIVHWGEPARGGHFGAWEQPDVFVQEVRKSLQSMKKARGRVVSRARAHTDQ
ncbi:epoxide hydrolase family protein [Kineosporia sp. NBRC 101731]|uniref:epoxide hydrolase family protein n=1 Tax=Kineosporia sp. NBRC 101731 TaxID=3032199 RepID=UPI0024A08A77|nr:epoxide hydrolase family protein [Kineosporia sp. NBRC 101731]GLY28746.1 hydrolase [Kineosporia sp. NBRC 101731]